MREIYVARYGVETVLKNLRHIDLDSEGTLATWFSAGILFACGALLAAIASLARQSGDADWRRWAVLAAIFVVLSIDEATAIHETLIRPLRETLKLSGALHFAWVIPAFFLVGAVGMFFLPFVMRLRRPYGLRFVVAGLIYVGGALGMELVGGYFASRYGLQSPRYIVAAMTEETLEIAGAVLFFGVLLAYLRDRWGDWRVTVR
jgi:hypothetical protein